MRHVSPAIIAVPSVAVNTAPAHHQFVRPRSVEVIFHGDVVHVAFLEQVPAIPDAARDPVIVTVDPARDLPVLPVIPKLQGRPAALRDSQPDLAVVGVTPAV